MAPAAGSNCCALLLLSRSFRKCHTNRSQSQHSHHRKIHALQFTETQTRERQQTKNDSLQGLSTYLERSGCTFDRSSHDGYNDSKRCSAQLHVGHECSAQPHRRRVRLEECKLANAKCRLATSPKVDVAKHITKQRWEHCEKCPKAHTSEGH